MPGRTCRNWYSPDAAETAARATPVSLSVRVSLAVGMTALVGSVTVPRNEEAPCAQRLALNASKDMAAVKTLKIPSRNLQHHLAGEHTGTWEPPDVEAESLLRGKGGLRVEFRIRQQTGTSYIIGPWRAPGQTFGGCGPIESFHRPKCHSYLPMAGTNFCRNGARSIRVPRKISITSGPGPTTVRKPMVKGVTGIRIRPFSSSLFGTW